ncbi:Lrp/AsnC family transcriptional regulator [Archaeoglobus profundus]|uniref:Transcriptional regulator, AsnC family n=1 Tax=Archaeoglobus profundus (strain DSM 5631 / JCM 9629 / NBRC 100127 / Av18) TaxID=572546 RepID=D2RGS5_ARCPA|nr:Lrp/AsnC family transcriptional regulator [Archaeoglobus profundus]ADB57500.1 transcriptional regulator, AsnC family [Archaeoglobus profundus DSM 5631]
MKVLELDEKDRLIIKILQENPKISQTEVAKLVGLSQPSVGGRIKKLKELGIIDHTYGVNLKNSRMYILKVDVKCKNPDEILDTLRDCPFFLNGFVVAGNRNLILMFVGEDLPTLEAIVDKHVRPNPDVYDVDVGIIVRTEKSTIIPLNVGFKRDKVAPCKSYCSECDYWGKICLGCPITGHYRGRVLR